MHCTKNFMTNLINMFLEVTWPSWYLGLYPEVGLNIMVNANKQITHNIMCIDWQLRIFLKWWRDFSKYSCLPFNAYNVEFSNLDKIFKLTFGEKKGKLKQYVTPRQPEKTKVIFYQIFRRNREKRLIFMDNGHIRYLIRIQ